MTEMLNKKSQAEEWLEEYEHIEGEGARRRFREGIEELEDLDVKGISQSELGGYPFYSFTVFLSPDRSVYVEDVHADEVIVSVAYGSVAAFVEDLKDAHSKAIENFWMLAR